MGVSTDYQLIDFGEGRKLERFGDVLLDRPSPAAEGYSRVSPPSWAGAVRFEKDSPQSGTWASRLPTSWHVHLAGLRFELRPTDFGHLGIFPEQAAHWSWMQSLPLRQCQVLNLFAYTGGSTLAAARAGASVAHVDAAKNIVAWARDNAQLNQMADQPIRWLVEDSLKFTEREVRRGRTYSGIILDPPSYGHGPTGNAWKLETNLEPLLSACRALLANEPAFVLFTCHSPGVTSRVAADLLSEYLPPPRQGMLEQGEMELTSSHNRQLPSGVFARWCVSR